MKRKERMELMLLDAAKQFLFYARLHLEKNPPEIEKAKVNIEWINRCHKAIENDKR